MKQLFRSSDTLVCLPTYNERPNVSGLVERIRKLPFSTDILFIDDNSPDGTVQELKRIADRKTGVYLIHRPYRLGVGSAHMAALKLGYEQGYRILITMDADGTHDPEDIIRLIEKSDKAEVVIGSRFLPAASDCRKQQERFQSRVVHRLTSWLLKMPGDLSNAFRLYRLDKIDPGIFSSCRSGSYAFFPESIYYLHQAGRIIREVPVSLYPRQAGKSKKRGRDFGEWIIRIAFLRAKGKMISIWLVLLMNSQITVLGL